MTYHPAEKSYWTDKQTFQEKYDMLEIDITGNIKVMLSMAEITAEGSFRYLTEKLVRIFLRVPKTSSPIFRIVIELQVKSNDLSCATIAIDSCLVYGCGVMAFGVDV